MRARLALPILSLLGCVAGEPSVGSEARVQAIVGGTIDDGGFPEVVFIALRFSPDAGVDAGLPAYRRCSATLITPTVALTAAHCTSSLQAPRGYQLTAIGVQSASPAPEPDAPGWTPATTWRPHPMWTTSTTTAFDIGAVKLSAPLPDAGTRPWSRRALTTADVGRPMTVVGFGITSASTLDPGTRRVVTLPLRGLQPALIQLGDFTDAGICNGDSGGPSILVEPDGLGRVIGVHSRTVPGANCMDGVDTRVDQYGAFIRQFLIDTGGASCVEDDLCASACAQPDPDCPSDCGANGVCATTTCTTPDPDCRPELTACASDTECQFRLCATDPQRPQRYCSRPCSATCPVGTSCVGSACLQPQLPSAREGEACSIGRTFCEPGTICTGPVGGSLTCRRTCVSDATCTSNQRCVAGQVGQICEPRPEVQPGQPCSPVIDRCAAPTTCTGLVGAPTTCQRPCVDDGECAPADRCVAAQNAARLCEVRPELPAGQICRPGIDRCAPPTTCTGPLGAPPTCQRPCVDDGDCAPADRCVAAQNSARLCEPRPEVPEGGSCVAGISRCAAGTTCSSLSGATTCRRSCVGDLDCRSGEQCTQLVCAAITTTPEGASCTTASRCVAPTLCSGLVGEPLTCRRVCQSTSDCGRDTECLPAQNGARLCTPRAPDAGIGSPCVEPTTCQRTCATAADCAGGTCVPGAHDAGVCVETTSNDPRPMEPAPRPGCSEAPTEVFLLLALLLLRLR